MNHPLDGAPAPALPIGAPDRGTEVEIVLHIWRAHGWAVGDNEALLVLPSDQHVGLSYSLRRLAGRADARDLLPPEVSVLHSADDRAQAVWNNSAACWQLGGRGGWDPEPVGAATVRADVLFHSRQPMPAWARAMRQRMERDGWRSALAERRPAETEQDTKDAGWWTAMAPPGPPSPEDDALADVPVGGGVWSLMAAAVYHSRSAWMWALATDPKSDSLRLYHRWAHIVVLAGLLAREGVLPNAVDARLWALVRAWDTAGSTAGGVCPLDRVIPACARAAVDRALLEDATGESMRAGESTATNEATAPTARRRTM